MDRIDAVLFGLTGVVLTPRTPAGRARVERAAGVTDAESFWRVYDDLLGDYEAGRVSDTHWWQQVAIRAGLPDLDLQEAVAADVDTRAVPDRAAVERALELVDAGYCCGAIDNAPAALASRLRADLPWLGELAAVTFSCDIGVAKPDPEAFRVAVDAMGAKPASTLYVDYRQEWVHAAEQLGMQGLVRDDLQL